ncbi:MAG: ArnT family glycosyltransferase [Chloroflexota bacterium]
MLAIIALVAIGLRVAFFFHAPVFFEGDARGYLVRAVEITAGDGFQFSLKRTPGYPLLLAAVFEIAGTSLEAVVLVQHLFGIATALLTFDCARRIAGRWAGLLAGLATATSGSMLMYEHVILTEALFTVLLVATLWLLLSGLMRRSMLLIAFAGLIASLGSMIRPVGLALTFAVPVLVLWVVPRRDALKLGAVFLAAFGLVMAPWVLRNALVHGEAEVVHPGRFLIERTITNNQTGIPMFAGPDRATDSRRIRTGRAILRAIESERPNSFEAHNALVRRMNLTDAQASDLLWDLAVDAIVRAPDVYVWGTWLELGELITGERETVSSHVADRRSSWKGTELMRLVNAGLLNDLLPVSWDEEGHRAIADAVTQLYQPTNAILLILGFSIIATAWGLRDSSRRLALLPVGMALALAACTLIINGAFPRYRYPLDPLLHMAAAAGCVWTCTAVRARVRADKIPALRRSWRH